jgi:hypothetical protein
MQTRETGAYRTPDAPFRVSLIKSDPPSVVIKVGMVGDSQIGKTSLMVKYVEGSFDEDYIQTLGTPHVQVLSFPPNTAHTLVRRRQLYGKDHFRAENDNHLFNMGSGRPAGVREHVTPRLQRRGCHLIHV